jgi:hypothetical protein
VLLPSVSLERDTRNGKSKPWRPILISSQSHLRAYTDHLTDGANKSFSDTGKEIEVLAIRNMIAGGCISPHELHIADLAFTRIRYDANDYDYSAVSGRSLDEIAQRAIVSPYPSGNLCSHS